MSLPVRECGLKSPYVCFVFCLLSSLPVRECGLKCNLSHTLHTKHTCHSLCGSVDWNRVMRKSVSIPNRSLPVRECGLKYGEHQQQTCYMCHSLCGSVDWNWTCTGTYTKRCSHSLCGSVDWNQEWFEDMKGQLSSLPVRECGLKFKNGEDWSRSDPVTPCAGVWIEITIFAFIKTVRKSHSLCGSVDWNWLWAWHDIPGL